MFKFFEKFVEFLSIARIALSPILIFLITGIVLYIYSEQYGTLLLIINVIIGLVLGILIAIRISKKQGATTFLSKIIATPELDKKDDK